MTALSGSVVVQLAAAALVAVIAIVLLRRARRAASYRVAVLGSAAAAEALAVELAARGINAELVGRITPVAPAVPDRHWLGELADIRVLVERHELDLLVLSQGVPRLMVFDELNRSCADLRVRLCELSDFYEQHFGQVPIAEINSAWLQYVMHPRFQGRPSAAKRAVDVALSASLAVAVAPVLGVLALLIRRDGGPALYRQVRVGEGGRPFTMLKLRTMRERADADTSWTRAGDDRVTRLGAWLRRTHIDELPQVINILRGEMSVVGPRPEQPHYVAALERSLPFYSRRHTLRPGLTGWAQVCCGYGGTETGTAWKLSHDLYYLKHQGLRLDLEILLRTLPTPFARDQFAEPEHRPLVLGGLALDAGHDVAPALQPELDLRRTPAQTV